MPESMALAISEILFTLACVMIILTAVTMLTARKRRSPELDAPTIEFIRAYEAEQAAKDMDAQHLKMLINAEQQQREKFRLSSQYGKYPNGHYYGGVPKYNDSDSIHEIDIDI